MPYVINTLLAVALVAIIFYACKYYPYKRKIDTTRVDLDRKLTYSSPEMCEFIERLDEHEAAIS